MMFNLFRGLSQALSRLGGSVTGVDASAQNVEAATARRTRQPQLRDLTYAHTTAGTPGTGLPATSALRSRSLFRD